MKTSFSLFILVLFCSVGFAAEKSTLSDDAISKALIGKWRISIDGNDVKINAIDVFLPNGTMLQKGVLNAYNQKLNIEMEATWKIEKGKPISSLLSVKPKGMTPIGTTSTYTVISIDNEKFVYKNEKTAEVSTCYRVNEKANN